MGVTEVKARLKEQYKDNDDVTGIGIGKNESGDDVVVVNVRHDRSHAVSIPQEFSSEEVEIRETGAFSAELLQQADEQNIDRKSRQRPVPSGVSAAHTDVTAGTTGFIVEDADGNLYPTSNNHVYANANRASVGDDVLQPGPADGGVSGDETGTLEGYVELTDGVKVDVAWINFSETHDIELVGVGKPRGTPTDPSVGDTLIKSGRTTGVTTGVVNQVNADISVSFPDGSYQIADCIITENMSTGGDSGSAVLMEDTNEPAGVLFAGSDTATAINKATNVEAATGFSIITEDASTTPTATVTLTLERESAERGNIEATVIDASGNLIEGADVTLSGTSEQTGVSDPNGSVAFADVEIGSYTVEATKDGFSSDAVDISSSDFN